MPREKGAGRKTGRKDTMGREIYEFGGSAERATEGNVSGNASAATSDFSSYDEVMDYMQSDLYQDAEEFGQVNSGVKYLNQNVDDTHRNWTDMAFNREDKIENLRSNYDKNQYLESTDNGKHGLLTEELFDKHNGNLYDMEIDLQGKYRENMMALSSDMGNKELRTQRDDLEKSISKIIELNESVRIDYEKGDGKEENRQIVSARNAFSDACRQRDAAVKEMVDYAGWMKDNHGDDVFTDRTSAQEMYNAINNYYQSDGDIDGAMENIYKVGGEDSPVSFYPKEKYYRETSMLKTDSGREIPAMVVDLRSDSLDSMTDDDWNKVEEIMKTQSEILGKDGQKPALKVKLDDDNLFGMNNLCEVRKEPRGSRYHVYAPAQGTDNEDGIRRNGQMINPMPEKRDMYSLKEAVFSARDKKL